MKYGEFIMNSKTLCQANMIQEQIEEITDILDMFEEIEEFPSSNFNRDTKIFNLLSFEAACTVKNIVISDLKNNLNRLEEKFKDL